MFGILIVASAASSSYEDYHKELFDVIAEWRKSPQADRLISVFIQMMNARNSGEKLFCEQSCK